MEAIDVMKAIKVDESLNLSSINHESWIKGARDRRNGRPPAVLCGRRSFLAALAQAKARILRKVVLKGSKGPISQI
ncbi:MULTISPECIES: hypothetical protein [Paenibacillus]|uniref:Uncharacterized protein n=1 Tax=Paenibacillus lactis TaxID=228574 RepID=A0ABS4FEV2_9BACL|nr:hypothetical protein [Paenibacillus lactis]MBP1894792.1 hypothetical protein [Paenibacillus lactis]